MDKNYQITITVEVNSKDEKSALNDAVEYIKELHDDKSLYAEILLTSPQQN